MYRAYWRLSSRPFDHAFDPASYYPGESHQAALLQLRYAVEHRAESALLVGEPGVGKTLLLQCLAQQPPEGLAPVLRIVFPQLAPDQFVAHVAHQLAPAESSEPATTEQSLRRLTSVLAENHRAGGHALVLLDEAQTCRDASVLETVRLLMNLNCDGAPVWTWLLCGQTSLLPLLSRYPEFDSRIDVKCLLQPFSLEETISYISHRLDKAGAETPIFEEAALETIHELSGGVPRRIHRLCDLALLIGFAEELERIDARCVESVGGELTFQAG